MQLKIMTFVFAWLLIINLQAMNFQLDESSYFETTYPDLGFEAEQLLGLEMVTMTDVEIGDESDENTGTMSLIYGDDLNRKNLSSFSVELAPTYQNTQKNKKTDNSKKRTRKRKAPAKKTEEKNEKNSLRLCRKCLKNFPAAIFYTHVKNDHPNYFVCLKCNKIHPSSQEAKDCCVSYMCRFCKEHFNNSFDFYIHSKNQSCVRLHDK